MRRFAETPRAVLLGTQMVSKGHHFAGVELAAVGGDVGSQQRETLPAAPGDRQILFLGLANHLGHLRLFGVHYRNLPGDRHCFRGCLDWHREVDGEGLANLQR